MKPSTRTILLALATPPAWAFAWEMHGGWRVMWIGYGGVLALACVISMVAWSEGS